MESSFLNWIIGLFHGTIMNTITSKLTDIENTLQQKVQAFNLELKNANATTFMTNVLNNTNYPLNMSMTEAPQLDATTNLVNLHFDGLFYDVLAKTTHVTSNNKFAPRYAGSHSEQVFLHESMINSLFFALEKTKMPFKI